MPADNEPPADNHSADDLHADDLTQYRQMYVDETEEQLDDLVETMLVLEEDPRDEASLASAFRLLHSMKGAAGMMGYDQITVLTHHLETRFERLRSGRIDLDRVTMNLTLRCIDFLRQCNDQLRDGTGLGTPDVLLSELRELEETTEKELEDGGLASETIKQQDDAPEVEQVPSPPPTSPRPVGGEGSLGEHYHVVVWVEETITLKETVARAVAGSLEHIGEIKATRPEMDEWDDCEDISPFDVILFTDLSANQILQSGLVEGVSDLEVRIPRDETSDPLATTRSIVSNAVSDDDEVGVDLAKAPTSREASIGTSVSIEEPATPNGKNPKTPQVPVASKQNETMRVDIDRLDNLMSLAGELVVNRAQFVQVATDLGDGLRQSGSTHATRHLQDTMLRIIDRLKLSDAKSDADWSASIQELQSGLELLGQHQNVMEESRRSFGRLDEAIDQLSRVSNSLQRGVLGTRMTPVSPLFNRFKRVVRDLSQDRGKHVTLILDGENTELDKRMIDAIGDPMVHLVRNSVDHGLESPEVRVAAGKPAAGTVSLSAQHRGNHVYITIADDGGGIDDAKIRKRLVDRGLLSESAANLLTRQEAIEYIWHAGFSTAEKVTDISGRGVGMDIVKSKIAELAGTIETESEVGIGTTFTLKLPLTLAIISSLLVEIRGIVFAIPKDDVREIVQIREADILTVANRQTFEIRGHYLPLITIDELFNWQGSDWPDTIESEDVATSSMIEVVILQSGDRTMGVRVHRAIGSQDVVIKSLAENFVSIDGLAGASILGDGSVALMLDVTAMLKLAITAPVRSAMASHSESSLS